MFDHTGEIHTDDKRADGRGCPCRAHRLIAHVQLCVLALPLERAAEIRCQQTWRTIRHTLDQLKVVRYRMQGKTIVQSTQVPLPMAEILQSLGIALPKKILEVFE